MMRTLNILMWLWVAVLFQAQALEPFKDGDRVLFLGDSITRSGNWHSLIALFYETRYPDRKITWLNAGISGDTSFGALERLSWDVLDRKPHHVVVMLGMNDSAREDLPEPIGSPQRIHKYRSSMEKIVEVLKTKGVSLTLCTPSPYDAWADTPAKSNPAASEALSQCASICRELAEKNKLNLVDFYEPMNTLALDFQKTNPKFTLIGHDRIHPGELGSTVMAHLFLKAQNVEGIVSETAISVSGNTLEKNVNCAVRGLSLTEDSLSFYQTEKSLPFPVEGDGRKALHLVPFVEHLNRQIIQVLGLQTGEYELKIDSEVIGHYWSDELAVGINISTLRNTPQYRQSQQVSGIHQKRHQLMSYGPRMVAFTRHFTLIPAGHEGHFSPAIKELLEKLIADPEAKNRQDLGLGSYAQSMAQQYLKFIPTIDEIAKNIEECDSEIRKLNQPKEHIVVLTSVKSPDRGKRMLAFNQRHTEENVRGCAEQFLKLLVLDDTGLMRSNLRLRKSYKPVVDLHKAGKTVEALNAYRDYVFAKLRSPASYGLPSALTDPYCKLIQESDREKSMVAAEKLMKGQLLQDSESMPPGAVWFPREKEGPNGVVYRWSPDLFKPLAVAYLLTGEQPYLDRWIEYLDDWAMFESTDGAIRATDISDKDSHSIGKVLAIYQILGGIARRPTPKDIFPADSLARILSKLIRIYPPLSILYFRSNPQNWTPGGTANILLAAALMDEFRASEHIFACARQRHENYGTIQFLPDGSETEHALWYNSHYFDGASEAMELAENLRRQPTYQRLSWIDDFCSPEWMASQTKKVVDRSRYFLQMLTPQSQYPIGNRSDQRKLPDWKSQDMIENVILNGSSDLKILLNTLQGRSAAGYPDFTMSAFPYSGSWLMREGWGAKDGYAHFFCSPYPVGGHALRGLKSNNGFWLSKEGQDLLVAGGFGSYSYDRSPVLVDGKEQFYLAGVANPGIQKNHKGFGICYIDPSPAPWRSFSNAEFDFAEGIYSGPYGDFVDDHHDNKNYRVDFLAQCAQKVITGIRHQRQIFHLKKQGLWIVVDRLNSLSPREYTLDWRLPAPLAENSEAKKHNRYSGKVFPLEALHLNEQTQSLTTTAPDMPNINIHHFGPQMSMKKTLDSGDNIKNDYTYKYKMYDFWRLSGSWRSSGNDLIVSLIETIPSRGTSCISSLEALGDNILTRGFKLRTSSGNSVSFMAAVQGLALLSSAHKTSILAECLLENNDAEMVLGSNSKGHFAYGQGGEEPIYSPIAPVKISPERHVILPSEAISFSSATENLDIRYTLDGSEPTVYSALYQRPFMLEYNCTVKARGFRKVCSTTPSNLAGTYATVVAEAQYKVSKVMPSVGAMNAQKQQSGLQAEYSEGDWKDLIFFPEQAQSAKKIHVKNIFERCQPQVSKCFRWTYSGLLDIPEDGIYTFYAPHEMVTSSQETGYHLRLFVGQELLSNGRSSGELNEWYPVTHRHAYGTWSIGLQKGLHPFKVAYVDYRMDGVERLNHPGLKVNALWDGNTPSIEVSGPNFLRKAIPKDWFFINK